MKQYLASFVALMGGGMAALPAMAEDYEARRCILEAASKVPTVQGLAFTGSEAKPWNKDAATKWIISTVATEEDALNVVKSFEHLDGKTDQALRNATASLSGYDSILQDVLSRDLDVAYTITLKFTAASQENSLQYGCMVTRFDRVFIKPIGLLD